MSILTLETEFDAFYPGTEARVVVSWKVNQDSPPPQAIEVRLVWNTSGKGDRDLQIVRTARLDPSTAFGQQEVMFSLPWGPYSFSGKLISVSWAIEAITFPGGTSIRKEIVIGPNSQEVRIDEVGAPPRE